MGLGSRDGDVRAPTAWAPGVWILRLRGARLGGCAAKRAPRGPGVGADTLELNKAIIKHCQCSTALLNNCSNQQQCFNLALMMLNNALIICTLKLSK